ncbi:MAG: hypothetical protein B9S34_01240 [Opitutia bacterium Tous-C1TDCM]|nr:MAG: hypothetical protein B9S34_01240 [Opitutae bacterium Tous-C1TDCM]
MSAVSPRSLRPPRAVPKFPGLVLALLALGGCAEPPPEWIFVPASTYRCEVVIAVPARLKVGEEVLLQATRTNGPWQRVRPDQAVPGLTPWTKEPPARQSGFEVTGNLHWLVAPAGFATFSGEARRERTVRFSQAGRYRIQARSAFPTPATSNEIEVVVE